MTEDFKRFISIKLSQLTGIWFRTDLNCQQFDKQQILIGEIIEKYEKDIEFEKKRIPFKEPIKEDQDKINAMAKRIAELTDTIYNLRTKGDKK